MSDGEKKPFLTKIRWGWFGATAGLTTVVLALLVVFVHYTAWKVLVFGWLPLVLLELFVATFAGRVKDRKRWLSFVIITTVGLLVSAWMAFAEGMTLWKVLAFVTLPFTVLMLLVTVFVKRRVAPYRVVQIIAAITINAYILAYVQNLIIYQGFFKYLPQPILNCYGGPLAIFACPIGSTQQMLGMKLLPWLPLGVFIVIGAFVGRAACAWVCPFGMWQDLLHKIRVGSRAKAKRWVSLAVTGTIAAVLALLVVLLLKMTWWKVFLFAWLPFMLALLYVVVRGKFDIPQRLWLGGALAAVGLGAFVWFKYEPGYGVVTAAAGLLLLGLTGRTLAALLAAQAAFMLGTLGPTFGLAGLSGATLGAVMAVVAFGMVMLFDHVLKVRMPSTQLKYWFLVLIAGVASYFTIEPWFCKLCPQGTLGAGIPLVLWDPVNALRGLVGWLYWVKVGFLLLVIVAAIAMRRPFCRTICPIGAIYALFNKASLLRMKLDKSQCTSCMACRRVCPMSINPDEDPNQAECIRCFECTHRCPQSGLSVGT